MNLADFKTLFNYNFWANARTRQAVESVPEEKLYVDMKNSFGSIHGTVVHIVGAEDIWLQRLQGSDRGMFMKKEEYPTYASVVAKWSDVEKQCAQFLSTVTEELLSRDLIFHNLKGEKVTQKVWMSLQHLVNHSTYHRGQITTLVRQAGGTPVSTDLIAYYRTVN
jgi:uncharacterized damage-inducible protein DinB